MGKQMDIDRGYESYKDGKAEFAKLSTEMESDFELVKTNSGFARDAARLLPDILERAGDVSLAEHLTGQALTQAEATVEALKRIDKNIRRKEALKADLSAYEQRNNMQLSEHMNETDEKSRKVLSREI